MKSDAITSPFIRRICGAIFLITLLSQCSDDEQMLATEKSISDSVVATADVSPMAVASCATCTYTVPSNTYRIDGAALGLKPGAVVCLKAGNQYKTILFVNLVGTASNPITITNCGGRVTVDGAGKSFGIKTENSKFFRITGGSDATYGILIKNANLGITLDKLSTNFEVDHVEVANVGFAGIMAKTDPSCDNATIRGNFTMRDISLHDNYIHETGGEGFYVGNSFYMNGVKLSCGTRLPHAIEGVKIYNNKVKNSGWEGIQLGSATARAEVYNNSIENYGTKNVANQRNGLQLGEGTGGLCYNNFIKAGPGNGIVLLGLGDNVLHDNIIVNAGSHGIFADERYSPGPGFKFVNNTIISPKQDGIRLYADLLPMNVIINNIIVNPGSYGTYKSPRTGDDAYVYKLSKNVKLQMSNNHFTRDINAVKFINASGSNYRLTSASPAVNKGKEISTYNIATDFYKQSRVKGSAVDIGASEY